MALGGWIAGILYDLTGSYTVSFINAIAFNAMNFGIAVFIQMKSNRQAGLISS
jgi:cyanate permease